MNNSEFKYDYKKTPLDYQISEYDCGTTTILNVLRYLFLREEIHPEVIKFINQVTLDKSNDKREFGTEGTSNKAMDFLCSWLKDNAYKFGMNIEIINLKCEEISIYNEILEREISNGAVAILSLYLNVEHYCMLTKIDEENAYLFDPYYLNINYCNEDNYVEIIKDKPFEYNRKVKKERMEMENKQDFSLVKGERGQIIILKRIK